MFLRGHASGEVELRVSLAQLKTLYLSLFRQLHSAGPEAFDALDEDDMLLTLQQYLQQQAKAAGVDCTDHAAWEAFLGVNEAPSCAARLGQRPPQP